MTGNEILAYLYHLYTGCVNSFCSAGKVLAHELQENGNIEETMEFTVILERIYIDGERSEETIVEKAASLEELTREYEEWELVGANGNRLILMQHVEDISPLLKANGYFGISGDDVLTIFNGRPDENQIINSFFQIDLGKLESRKRIELENGIQVKSKDEFESVLEAFKSISIEKFQ